MKVKGGCARPTQLAIIYIFFLQAAGATWFATAVWLRCNRNPHTCAFRLTQTRTQEKNKSDGQREREREKGPAHTGSRVASKRQVKEVVVLVFAVLC